jgi:hypothetical protein
VDVEILILILICSCDCDVVVLKRFLLTLPSLHRPKNYEPNFSCQFERRVGGNGNGDGPKVSLFTLFSAHSFPRVLNRI